MKSAEINLPTHNTDKLWKKVWKLAGADLWDNRKTLAVSYFFGIVAVSALLLLPWPLKLIIDHVMSGYDLPKSLASIQSFLYSQGVVLSKEDKVIIFATTYTFIALFVTLCGSAEKMTGARVRENMVLRIRDKILLHFQNLSSLQRSNYRSGDVGMYILVDVHHLVRLLTKTIPLIFRHLATTVFTLSIMFWLEPWLAAAGLLMVIILAILVRFQGTRLRHSSRQKRKQEGIVSGYTQECVRGMTTVQALSAENHIRHQFLDANRSSLQAGIRETAAAVSMERTMQIINGIAVALIMGGGATFVLRDQLTVGDLTVFVAYMVQLLKPVEKINEMASAVSRGLTRAEHLTCLLNIQPAVEDKPNVQSINNCKGIIELRSVNYYFSEQSTERSVLKNISFKLRPGQLTVLIGSSGSGKSTLLNLILRQLTPTSGEILIDGKPYDEVSLVSLRAQFSVMLQQHHLFSGKLQNSLWLNHQPINENHIWQALASVDMKNYIQSLPLGLATIVDEDGHNFSGGQRARLSLARAMLLDRPILLLDEPLANIDMHSQQIILNALEIIRQHKTCLVISHTPALIDRANQLLKIENGLLNIQLSSPTEKHEKKTCANSVDILL